MKPKPEVVDSMSEDNRLSYFVRLTTDRDTSNDGLVLPDPYVVLQEEWNSDDNKWPPLQYADIYHYLILTPSEFTHESLKAYRSLEAYNYFISGHVQKCYYNQIEGREFCFIRSLVLPGQRQNPRDDNDYYDAWICVHDSGVVFTASCTCMAG